MSSQFRDNGNQGLEGGEEVIKSQGAQHLLSNNESRFCTSLDITPSEYITLKAVLLKEPYSTVEDTSLESQVRSFIKSKGWISPGLQDDNML